MKEGGICRRGISVAWIGSYVVEFMVCSFAGWLYEVLLNLAVYHVYADRGVLHLPVCPIYGFGGLILLVLFRRRNEWPVVFLVSTVLTTVIELVSSYLLEWAGLRLWDYSAWPVQFEGRISLLSSLLFGLMSLALVKGAHPLMRYLYRKLPAWCSCAAGLVLGAVLLTDSVRTLLLPLF